MVLKTSVKVLFNRKYILPGYADKLINTRKRNIIKKTPLQHAEISIYQVILMTFQGAKVQTGREIIHINVCML